MVPIKLCRNKNEAKRVEDLLIQKWKPNLNKEDIPFWRHSQTHGGKNIRSYKGRRIKHSQHKHQQSEDDDNQYSNSDSTSIEQGKDNGSDMPIPVVTSYQTLVNGTTETYNDLSNLLRDLAQQNKANPGPKRVVVHEGKNYLTNWRKIKDLFGNTIFTFTQEGTNILLVPLVLSSKDCTVLGTDVTSTMHTYSGTHSHAFTGLYTLLRQKTIRRSDVRLCVSMFPVISLATRLNKMSTPAQSAGTPIPSQVSAAPGHQPLSGDAQSPHSMHGAHTSKVH